MWSTTQDRPISFRIGLTWDDKDFIYRNYLSLSDCQTKWLCAGVVPQTDEESVVLNSVFFCAFLTISSSDTVYFCIGLQPDL